MKVYVAGHGFDGFFLAAGHSIISEIDHADMVLFTGGADVSPSLYNEKPRKETRSDWGRDQRDLAIYSKACSRRIPTVGICRGAQFLNVMAGGTLHQHVEGHLGQHKMVTSTGDVFSVTSTHHQMLCLPSTGSVMVLGWANEKTNPEVDIQPEVVYYPEHRSLAVQYHPEYMDSRTKASKYFFHLLDEYIV